MSQPGHSKLTLVESIDEPGEDSAIEVVEPPRLDGGLVE
jgi:hypothetical protein